MSYQVEVTDTFGGEANYCWVKRTTIPDNPTEQTWGSKRATYRRKLVRQAKAFAGWTGLRCETDDSGDMITIRPRGMCQVCFVTWQDE